MIDKTVTESEYQKAWEVEYLDTWGYIGVDGKLILDEVVLSLDESLTNLLKAAYFIRQCEEVDGANDHICDLIQKSIRAIQSKYKNIDCDATTSPSITEKSRIEKTIIDYHPSGNKKSELSYKKDGKQEGLQKRWYKNGNKESEILYKDGMQDGLETCWHVSGYKRKETHYFDGQEQAGVTYWGEDGGKTFMPF